VRQATGDDGEASCAAGESRQAAGGESEARCAACGARKASVQDEFQRRIH
jgi:hypothetical protein